MEVIAQSEQMLTAEVGRLLNVTPAEVRRPARQQLPGRQVVRGLPGQDGIALPGLRRGGVTGPQRQGRQQYDDGEHGQGPTGMAHFP